MKKQTQNTSIKYSTAKKNGPEPARKDEIFIMPQRCTVN
jgi:hypothetical protein